MAQIFDSIAAAEVPALLTGGAVGVLPTDTVYGLVCRAADVAAANRLYDFKKREHKPGTIIAANIDQLVELGLTRRYLKAVEQFWPGAVSVIIPSEPALAYLDMGKQSLACRLPDNDKLLGLLEATGPLLTTSANHPGEPPAATVTEAQAYFGEAVDFYVNGGDLSNKKPSTVIRVIDDAIEILRPGAVIVNEAGEINV